MNGCRSTFCLALLFALAFCAFAAQSAMAQVGNKSVNTTAVTCVEAEKPGTGDFEDEHCDDFDSLKESDYEHEAILLDTTTEIEVEAEGLSKHNWTLAGVATEFTCTTVKSVNDKSFLHNVETSGKHTVTGTVQVEFTGCTVNKPTKCTIKEPIKTTANAVGVEGLGPNNDTMGVEFVGTGANKDFMETTFENKGAEKCSLLNGGKAFIVKGSMIATGTGDETGGNSGATLVFEGGNEMETLEFGLKTGTFDGEFLTTMADGGDPIALTTTT